MKFVKIVSLLSVFAVAGCGTLVGAGAGGLGVNQFGKGKGKDAATAAGVVGGGILGHELIDK